MLNKELLGSQKDVEIARLKMTIEKFKEYDRKRTAYYADKMQRLGELEAYIAELEDGKAESAMQAKIVRQADEIRKLRKHIQAHGIETNQTEEELTEIISKNELKMQVRKWRREAKRLKKENAELIMRLNRGERATGEGNDEGSSDL